MSGDFRATLVTVLFRYCAMRLPESTRTDHDGNVTPMPEPSILSVLRERTGLQPDDTTFTSGKIRRGACVEQYRHAHFTNSDA